MLERQGEREREMTGGYSEYDGEVELRRLGSPKI